MSSQLITFFAFPFSNFQAMWLTSHIANF